MVREWERQTRRLRDELRAEFPRIGEVRERSVEPLEDGGADPPATVRLSREVLRPSLFDYQRDLVQAVLRAEEESVLVALPTGAGKTRTAVAAALEGIGGGRFVRVIWLAPTVELVDQAFETFEGLWLHQGNVGCLTLRRGLGRSLSEPVVVMTTPQAVHARQRQNRVAEGWDLIVFDEAHQLGARTYRDAVNWLLGNSRLRRTILVGLSATPGRVDPKETEDLVALFGGNLLHSDVLKPNAVKVLQRRGVLAKLRFASLSKLPIALNAEGVRLLIAARTCQRLVAHGRRPLVFAGTVAGGIVLADALDSVGVKSEMVHSGMTQRVRRSLISDFAAGRCDVLVNQRLLTTGYDCPAVSDVLILSRIQSPILFEQVVGRAARGPRTGGPRVATVWDFDDHLRLHGLPQSYYRYRDYDWT